MPRIVVNRIKLAAVSIALFLPLWLFFCYHPGFTTAYHFTLRGQPEARDIHKVLFSQSQYVISGPKAIETNTTLNQLVEGSDSLLINFWATWCPPCVEELPALEYLSRQLERMDVSSPRLVTISVDESRNDVLGLFDMMASKPTLIVLHDPERKLAEQFGTSKYPETYWIRKDGKIIRKWVGPQAWLSADVLRYLATSFVR
jgi:thiol-disulfide isomerase/thioredoxin